VSTIGGGERGGEEDGERITDEILELKYENK